MELPAVLRRRFRPSCSVTPNDLGLQAGPDRPRFAADSTGAVLNSPFVCFGGSLLHAIRVPRECAESLEVRADRRAHAEGINLICNLDILVSSYSSGK